MALPQTKIFLSNAYASGGAVRFLPNAAGDFGLNASAYTGAPWLSGILDLNGDGVDDLIFGAPGDDDKAVDAGRVFVQLAPAIGGSTVQMGDTLGEIIIDGVKAGDRAGAAVGSAADLNGDGKAEILVGAPGMEVGLNTDAGAGFVLWGQATAGGIDLKDPFSGGGKGYALKGEAAGDVAGTAILSVADLNGDGKVDIVVGAPGNDGGGNNAGAAYVVWGKSSNAVVNLGAVAAGTGGYKIVGDNAGDAVGSIISTLSDQNGDGKAELLIGAASSQAGGLNSGAVYVAFGKSSTSTLDLTSVAAGAGGYRITGVSGDDVGGAVSSVGDVNGDGIADILIGAAGCNSAYLVWGKSSTSNVNLADVRLGVGGLYITGASSGTLSRVSVTGGADLNRDGLADWVIGTPADSEGGANAGAVYVVWGGGSRNIDLALVAQGVGGAKVVGAAGSLLGSTVSITSDKNGDGTADLLIGAPGTGESAYLLYTPASWQSDTNVYGSNGNDWMTLGFGDRYKISVGNDVIYALGSDDHVMADAGHDSVDGGSGNDTLIGGTGNDTLDGGTGNDALFGAAGDDVYVLDSINDLVTERVGDGIDTVRSSTNAFLTANVENLVLTGLSLMGTGNELDNLITGGTGNDSLNGAAGADTLVGGLGNDAYMVDNAGDVVTEDAAAGQDNVLSSIDYTLGANLEGLSLGGNARRGTGNDAANTLIGTVGNDELDGAGGVDTMNGGLGDDRYVLSQIGDVAIEAVGGGTDTVVANINTVLGANIENLTLAGAASSGTGNALANLIIGNISNDTLDGAAGADTLRGGAGDDLYKVDNAADQIEELAGEGVDTVWASVDYSLSATEVEKLVLLGTAHMGTGNSVDNVITGTASNDTLDGAAGADTLIGGAGDDLYVVNVATDVVTELAAGGTDTVRALGDYILGAEVEAMEVWGEGIVGTGNALNNLMTGAAGGQRLNGAEGQDTLDGGAGVDTLAGGLGDDSYLVDNVGDVVIEAVDEGVDTLYASVDLATTPDGIEVVRLTGDAHQVGGNAGNNRLAGGTGDDDMDGGAGDDTLLGGDGNDRLVSRAGFDTLAGGDGDDRYVISGGTVHLEDFLGHDTLDASESWDDNYIDLSGVDISHIDDHDCDPGHGGTELPLDVQFLQDLSGSFGDDIATVRGLVPSIVTALRAVQQDSVFGASTFIDKPISPFGIGGEWVYRMPQGLTSDQNLLTAAYNAMVIGNGLDEPEAQIESLMQLALHAKEVGFRTDAGRFVVLFTDAPFHKAGDGASAGITTSNNGDAFTPGDGALEDYPVIQQVKAALEAANIIPIFAIANNYEGIYQNLATDLGRGEVVTLTADSSNIVEAILAGLEEATTTHIEDAEGGHGNDTLRGGSDDNHLWGRDGNDLLLGMLGNDKLEGGRGNDTLSGGVGQDTAVFSGQWRDFDASLVADVLTLTDHRVDGQGSDLVDTVETITFDNGSFALASILNVGPVALDDLGTTLVEGSSTAPGVPTAQGDVLANDSDANLATAGLGETLQVAGLRGGGLGAGGAWLAVGTVVQGSYGSLTVQADGSYAYSLDNARAATQALNDGDLVQEVFSVRVVDAHGAESLSELRFDIQGTTDPIPTVITPQADSLLVTIGLASSLGAAQLLNNDSVNPVLSLAVTGVSNAVNATVNLVDGRLVVTASKATGGFDYQVTASDGTLATGHVNLSGVTTNKSANVVTAAANFTAADLQGQAGNDQLTGEGGADRLLGGLGNDTLNGAGGADALYGGAGNDQYVVDSLGDLIFEVLGEGADVVLTELALFTLSQNVENLTATGLAGLNGSGNSLGNVLTGAGGNDVLHGLEGKDTLWGGAGADVLHGGAGVDSLTGGLGADTFLFDLFSDLGNTRTTTDTLADFSQAQGDHIDLSALDANSLLAGDQAFSYLGAGAFTRHAGELRSVATATGTTIYGDLNGDGVADFLIKVSGNITLQTTDFVL